MHRKFSYHCAAVITSCWVPIRNLSAPPLPPPPPSLCGASQVKSAIPNAVLHGLYRAVQQACARQRTPDGSKLCASEVQQAAEEGAPFRDVTRELTDEELSLLEPVLEAHGGLRPLLLRFPRVFSVARVGGLWTVAPGLNAPTQGAESVVDTPPPPPPTPAEELPNARAHRIKLLRVQKETQFSPQHLTHIIPTFFVSVVDVVAQLPGYSVEHIVQYFDKITSTELVVIDGTWFVRVNGGKNQLNLRRSNEAHQLFARHFPDPRWASALASLFPENGWLTADELVARFAERLKCNNSANENESTFLAGIAKLHDGSLRTSLVLYMHRLPHLFTLTTANGNMKDLSSTSGVHLGLVSAENSALTSFNSPCPFACQEIIRTLARQQMEPKSLFDKLTQRSRDEVALYFPDATSFCEAHRGFLYNPPGTNLAMLSWEQSKHERLSMSLEDQRAHALECGDLREASRLRKKIAETRDPDNALNNDETLAMEACKFLPQRGFVEMRQFVRTMLPPEITDRLPHFPNGLFLKFPAYCTVFEWKEANWVQIMRPDVPLPAGALRRTYTDAEIILMSAEMLRKGPLTTSLIMAKLPLFARLHTTKHIRGGLAYLFSQHPNYFTVVYRNAVTLDGRGAVVTLVAFPSEFSGSAS